MTTIERFLAKIDVRGSDECWPWKGHKTKSGHGQFWANGKHVYAHRFYLDKLYDGGVPADKFVLHKCNNASCCNWRHLYVGTKSDNMRDCVAAGTHRPPDNRGERHGLAKLTTEQVIAIKAATKSQRTIAREHGVSQAAVWAIRSGKRWRHI